MKRVVVIALVALSLPMAAWATSFVDYANTLGTLTVSNMGVTISSPLTAIAPRGGPITTGNLGTVSIATGALTGGNLGGVGSVIFGTGSITIKDASQAVLFSGTFTSAALKLVSVGADGDHQYQFFAVIGDGSTTQTTFNTGKAFLEAGTYDLASGNTIAVIPEPGTLGLLGTGLLGIAGLVRRKLTS